MNLLLLLVSLGFAAGNAVPETCEVRSTYEGHIVNCVQVARIEADLLRTALVKSGQERGLTQACDSGWDFACKYHRAEYAGILG